MEILSCKPVQFTGIGLPFENLNRRCFHVVSPEFKDLFPGKIKKGIWGDGPLVVNTQECHTWWMWDFGLAVDGCLMCLMCLMLDGIMWFDVFDVTLKKSRSKRRPILARPKSVSLKWLKGLCSQHHITNREKTGRNHASHAHPHLEAHFLASKWPENAALGAILGSKFHQKISKIMEHVLAERKPFQPCSMKWMKWRCDCCDCYWQILLSLELQISVANPFVMQIF